MSLEQILNTNQKVLAAIIFCSFLLYGTTYFNGFSIDDHLVTNGLEMVGNGVAGIPEILTTYYGRTDLGDPFEYRPIARITFAIEHSLWENNAGPSHLINVLLYAWLVFMVFRFLLVFLGSSQRNLVLFATALFLFHPIHTEVVCSLKNRDEILSLIFALLSGVMMIRFIDRKKWTTIALALLFFLLSLLTKPGHLAIAGIVVLGLWLFKKKPIKDLIMAGLPYFILVGIYFKTVWYFFPDWWRTVYAFEENSLYMLSFTERLPTSFLALLHNLRLVLVPHPLSFYYGYDHISATSWSNPLVWAGMAALITALFSFFKFSKDHKIISFGIGIFFMSISPFLGVISAVAGVVTERWLLAPSIGFSLILAYIILQVYRSAIGKTAAIIFTLCIFTLYGFKTITRIPDWKNERTLVYHDVKVVPRSFVPNFLAADFYLKDAETATDEVEWKKSIKHALKSNEMLAEICVNKAPYLKRCADQSAMINDRQRAIDHALNLYTVAFDNLNYSLGALDVLLLYQQSDKGLSISKEIVNRYPAEHEPYEFMGHFLMMKKDTASAISNFSKALIIDNSNKELKTHVQKLQEAYLGD